MSVLRLNAGAHIAFTPGIGVNVITPRGVAVPWWLAGGINPANCLAAYTAKGAASLAASYDNNAAPGNGLADGTYDAVPVVAPTWNAATGWTFNGTDQYLTTGGLNPNGTIKAWSMFVRFANASAPTLGGGSTFMGSFNGTNTSFMLWSIYANKRLDYYSSGAVAHIAAGFNTTGITGMAANKGYWNDEPVKTIPTMAINVTSGAMNIAAYGGGINFFKGDWLGGAVWNIDITAFIPSVVAAMAAF